VDGGLKLAYSKDLPKEKLTAWAIITAAKEYQAELTPNTQIAWNATASEWQEKLQFRPSVMDAVILTYSRKVGPSYLQAAQAATGWPRQTILGFLEIMLLGAPVESAEIQRKGWSYWRGVIAGLFVYAKLRRH